MRRTPLRLAIGALAAAVSLSTIAGAQGQVRPRQARPGVPPGAAPAPGGAPAQPPVVARRGGAGGADGARGLRGGRGGSPAANLLRLRQQLELTDDQVKRLEALASAAPQRPNPADAMRARADLMDATRGDGNLANARAVLDRMAKQRNDQVIARLKAQQDARAVLTAAQKTRLDNVRGAVRERVARRGAPGVNRRGQLRQGGMGRGMGRAMGFRGGRRGMGPGLGAGFGAPRGFGPPGGFGPGMRGFRPGMGPQGPQGMRQRMGPDGMGPDGMGPGGMMGPGFGPQGQPMRRRRFDDSTFEAPTPSPVPPAALPPIEMLPPV